MPGDVKYMDLNNDKMINNGNNTLEDMGDMCVIGNTTPRYQYTLNGSISWKGISLSMMFQGIGKTKLVSRSRNRLHFGDRELMHKSRYSTII
mgnify:CR=1 FL=1